MIDYLSFVVAESDRFRRAVESVPTDRWRNTIVPSCPDWSLPDLIWHLSEVQHFWATMFTNNLPDPSGYDRPTRPDDHGLLTMFNDSSALLITALTGADPTQPCWSWYEPGQNVGWVLRRQAHEALVHRVDAELAADQPTAIDEALAADGVDEVLSVMLDVGPLPNWARYETDKTTVKLVATDLTQEAIADQGSWMMTLGRFIGADPEGATHDLPALQLFDETAAARPEVTATVTGPASELNLWLWGRAALERSTITGDQAAVDQLRAVATDATQ